MSKRLTVNKIEVTRLSLQQMLECDLPNPTVRKVLDLALRAVDTIDLAGGIKAEDHMPQYFDTPHGRLLGCSCGHVANKSPARISTWAAHYHNHLNSLGLSRPPESAYPSFS